MKKIGIILLLGLVSIAMPGQENKNENRAGTNEVVTSDSNEITKVIVGNELFSVEDNKEALKFRIANRGFDILETLEGPKINFERFKDDDAINQDDKEDKRTKNRMKFKGHWSGIEIGFNNYVASGLSMSLPADIYYMTLNSGISNNFNLNFIQHSFGMTRRFGLLTGMGINWNNYKFDGNNNIKKNYLGVIEADSISSHLEKSKFTTIYLTLPLLLEVQIPADNHHINLAGGFIGAVKLGSHTKMVFEDGDKIKSHGDLSLNLLRCGTTARLGFENLQIYSTWYLTPLFKAGKGPGGYNLYPFEIGLSFTFND